MIWCTLFGIRVFEFVTLIHFYFISTEIYPQRWQWWKNRSIFSHSQSATRTMNVWLDERCTGSHVILGAKTCKPPLYFEMSERFVNAGSVDNFIAEQENKATLQKTQTLPNLFRKQEWTEKSWRNSSIRVERVQVRVYNLGQNQRWQRL